MKYYTIYIALFISGILFSRGQMQPDDEGLLAFKRSLIKHVSYPELLKTHCVPTITIIRITLNDEGQVTGLELSDSARDIFVTAFNNAFTDIDIAALEKYMAKNQIRQSIVLLPLRFEVARNNCYPQYLKSDLAKLYMFDGNPLQGKAHLLPPIDIALKEIVEN